jgi:hypothetical protein
VKKITAILALMVFSLLIFLPFSPNVNTASAQDTGYVIQNVDHQVEVMYSGHVIIRDTVTVTGQITGDFLIGFPYKYSSYVLKCIAYDVNNVLPISLGVQVEGQSDFYGAKISFPQGSSQVFTVIFILSNDLVSYDETTQVFSLDFPAYPSFMEDAARCNVTLVVPGGATHVTIVKDDGTVTTTNFVKDNLAAFTYSPANASFVPADSIQIIDIRKLDRIITVSPVGDIAFSDTYRIVSKSQVSLGSLEISLPSTASNIVGRDEFGRVLTAEVRSTSGNAQVANFTLISALNIGQSTLLTAEYALPSVAPEQTQFSLAFDLLPHFDYYVDETSVTIIPPEGARFLTAQLSEIGSQFSLNRGIFQDTLSISREGVSYVDQLVPSESGLQVTYDYNSLWLSFHPTLWVWLLAVIGCITLAFRRRLKASAPPEVAAPKISVGVSTDNLRDFTEAYEEKIRITSELKSLDARAQKGKIPRRRYKVQRRTIEARSDALSKKITELKRAFRSGGGLYADLVRQLDIAETELDEVETEIESVEARHRRGELSLEDYKKNLADCQRRKEKAETAVNGILLRLREEIR